MVIPKSFDVIWPTYEATEGFTAPASNVMKAALVLLLPKTIISAEQ